MDVSRKISLSSALLITTKLVQHYFRIASNDEADTDLK